METDYLAVGSWESVMCIAQNTVVLFNYVFVLCPLYHIKCLSNKISNILRF